VGDGGGGGGRKTHLGLMSVFSTRPHTYAAAQEDVSDRAPLNPQKPKHIRPPRRMEISISTNRGSSRVFSACARREEEEGECSP